MKKLIEKTKDTLSIFHSSKGFTLLELLVVVLIIGILAGIALPQYRTAVTKSKLAQLDFAIETAKKNIEMYLYTNDWPTGNVLFTGTDSVGAIEMPGNCSDDDAQCYIDIGNIVAFCGTNQCTIEYNSQYNGSTMTNTNWLGGAWLHFILNKNSNVWVVQGIDSIGSKSDRKIVCQWLRERNYPTTHAKLAAICEEVGITLDVYEG